MTHPLNTPIGRFGITTVQDDPRRCAAEMPMAGLRNPLTGAPTVAPLAVLVDHIGGLINHHRRDAGEWTVSSELSMDLIPGAATLIAAQPDTPVRAWARPVGAKTTTALALGELSHGDTVLGTATVRSFYIRLPGEVPESPNRTADLERKTGLTEIMSVRAAGTEGDPFVLRQLPDEVLNNSIGIVHGGVAATGVALAAAAALNAGPAGERLATASLRVNFLRRFLSGRQSRYAGTALRVGRSTGLAEGKAIGDDGRVAIVARLTAYR